MVFEVKPTYSGTRFIQYKLLQVVIWLYIYIDDLTSLSDRLPTVSASEALLNLSDHEHGPSNVLTGVPDVDDALGDGFELGKVTELWGPVGAGKTAMA